MQILNPDWCRSARSDIKMRSRNWVRRFLMMMTTESERRWHSDYSSFEAERQQQWWWRQQVCVRSGKKSNLSLTNSITGLTASSLNRTPCDVMQKCEKAKQQKLFRRLKVKAASKWKIQYWKSRRRRQQTKENAIDSCVKVFVLFERCGAVWKMQGRLARISSN